MVEFNFKSVQIEIETFQRSTDLKTPISFVALRVDGFC